MAEDSTGLCIGWTEDCLSGRPRRARRRCPGRGASRERRRRPQGAGPPPNIFSCTAHYILLQLLLSTPPLLSHHLLHRGRCGRLIHPSALSRRACSSRCALLSARRTGPRPSRLRSRCFNRDVSSPVELHATRRAPAGQEFLLPSPVTSVVITPARQQRVEKKGRVYKNSALPAPSPVDLRREPCTPWSKTDPINKSLLRHPRCLWIASLRRRWTACSSPRPLAIGRRNNRPRAAPSTISPPSRPSTTAASGRSRSCSSPSARACAALATRSVDIRRDPSRLSKVG